MTDDLRLPGRPDADAMDDDMDAPLDPDRRDESIERSQPSPWLREGADAPDAADIEEPDEQR